jgi:PPOX class probable F420-dependent enzyme
MSLELPDAVRTFLRQPNPSVMATVARDGRPVAAATWYLLEDDGRVLINFASTRARLAHVKREPRVSLDVLDAGDWYTHVSLQLRVTEITDDDDLADIDALARQYTGSPYADRAGARVSARAEVAGWLGWGALAPA